MAADGDASLELERSFRRDVRKAYYRREADFATLLEYNDYLEEVEDLIVRLLDERTRADTQTKLRELGKLERELTARNRALFDEDRRRLEERAYLDSDETKRRAEARARAEQEAAEEQARVKAELLEKIASGKANAATAQSELRKHAQLVAALASAGGGGGSSAISLGQTSGLRLQAQPLPGALLQPLHPVPDSNGPKLMVRSRDLKREDYEDDPLAYALVCAAGGLRRDTWRKRYREEAFNARALTFVPFA
uniref:MAT1 centre domain-containing protein n=1 Tax=Coccolithus braarudii TaxID=221442 RepID=A0A7S0L1E5_9EUKA|mmetsp:Transcript_12473/g.26902  ORF Transcript_12473/g.26902 Transcript_12473/m.26902 type:complete len:252 (+) Transcript_12473:92-847(+)